LLDITNHLCLKVQVSNIVDNFVALKTIYPEYNWDDLYFRGYKMSYWSDLSNQQKYFEKLAKEFNIEKPEDWNIVTQYDIKRTGGNALLKYYGYSMERCTYCIHIVCQPNDGKPRLKV
jgi:hypothetical protein